MTKHMKIKYVVYYREETESWLIYDYFEDPIMAPWEFAGFLSEEGKKNYDRTEGLEVS